MKRLTQEAYSRARDYLKTRARPIERALFERKFEGGPLEAVVEALEAYQNPDGGFGHALEPDTRTPSSSALATGHALRMLTEAGCPAGHPIARRAVQHALDTLDPQTGVWRIVPPDTNDYPHAPWWHDDESGLLARTFDNFVASPRGEILACLYHFGAPVPRGWLDELAERTVADIEKITPSGGSFEYSVLLAEAPGLPAPLRERLARHLRAAVPEVVEQNPENWGNYGLPPAWAAPHPGSVAADLLRESTPLHLDYIIDTQQPDGHWDPNWSWFGMYPEVWEQQALPEWCGELTLRNLGLLRAYNLID